MHLRVLDWSTTFANAGAVKTLTPVDDRKVNGLGCNVMKPPARRSGTRGRICPEVSLNLQENLSEC